MSRTERQGLLSDFWTKPTAHELDLEHSDTQLKIRAAGEPSDQLTSMWLGRLKELYPQDHYSGSGHKFKMHPETGVTLKLNRLDGSLRIKGKRHLDWFKRNFDHMIASSGQEHEAIAELTKTINNILCLEDDLLVESLLSHLPPHGAIKHGPSFIYRLWRGLLDHWLAQPGTVYLVTPLLDAARLAELLLLLVKHRLVASAVKVVTRQRCDGQDKFPQVLKQAKKLIRQHRTTSKERLVAEERLKMALQRIQTGVGGFHCKFAAYVGDGRAEMLLTSANFHKWHFDFDNGDVVMFVAMAAEDFRRDYSDPLGLENSVLSSDVTASLHDSDQLSATVCSDRTEAGRGDVTDGAEDTTLENGAHAQLQQKPEDDDVPYIT